MKLYVVTNDYYDWIHDVFTSHDNAENAIKEYCNREECSICSISDFNISEHIIDNPIDKQD